MFPNDLPAAWREKADGLEEFGATEQATTLRRCANDLEQTAEEWGDEALTLTDAATYGGYSADHLGRLVRQGKLPNAGRPNAPRILRRHVPIRSTRGQLAPNPYSIDTENEQIVRSIIEGVQR